jgi:hypothetical protein
MNIKFECPGRCLVPYIEMARNHETAPAFIHQQILPSPPVQGIFTGFIQLGKAQLPWLLARTDRITRDASTFAGSRCWRWKFAAHFVLCVDTYGISPFHVLIRPIIHSPTRRHTRRQLSYTNGCISWVLVYALGDTPGSIWE